MKTTTKTYGIYEFDELSKEAQERAINDHVQFTIETQGDDPDYVFINDSVAKSEALQTPWFLPEIVYEDHKEDIIDTIKANQYGFFVDGELISLDMYPDNWTE